jgi:hypothetical protein
MLTICPVARCEICSRCGSGGQGDPVRQLQTGGGHSFRGGECQRLPESAIRLLQRTLTAVPRKLPLISFRTSEQVTTRPSRSRPVEAECRATLDVTHCRHCNVPRRLPSTRVEHRRGHISPRQQSPEVRLTSLYVGTACQWKRCHLYRLSPCCLRRTFEHLLNGTGERTGAALPPLRQRHQCIDRGRCRQIEAQDHVKQFVSWRVITQRVQETRVDVGWHAKEPREVPGAP